MLYKNDKTQSVLPCFWSPVYKLWSDVCHPFDYAI